MVEFSPRFKTRVNQATTGLTIAAATAAMVVPAMTHEAPQIGSGKTSMDVSETADWYAQQPKNQPSWTRQLRQEFEGFRNMENKPEGAVPTEVVAVQQNGTPKRMPFDKAWELSHDDNSANDIWTVGGKWGRTMSRNSVYQTIQIALMGAQARGEVTESDAKLASIWVDLQETLQDK